MGLGGLVILLVSCLALGFCEADSDGHEAALRKTREHMEDAGYECLGSVGILDRPADLVALNNSGGGNVEKTQGAVTALWRIRGWGNPQDMDSISFLEDGTLCVHRKNLTSSENRMSEFSTEVDGQDDSMTQRQGGRKLFHHIASFSDQSTRSGLVKETLRGLRQATGSSFDQELPIPNFEERIKVTPQQSIESPFSSIGQVWFGCSGALVGPCHYLTAGHCVFDPLAFQVRRPIDFNPGRNGLNSLFPLGRFQAVRTLPAVRWTTMVDPRYDAAIVQVQGRPGDEIGTFEMGAEGLPRDVALNIAGYPGDEELGEMWYDFCPNVILPFGVDPRLMVQHTCTTAPGSSGSAMWTYSPSTGRRQIAAIHTSRFIRFNPFTGAEIGRVLGATFLEGDLLREMQAAIESMPCDS